MVSSVFHHQQRSTSSLIMPSAAQKMPSYTTTVSPTHRRGDGSFVDSVCYTAFASKRSRPLMISQNVDYTSVLNVETSVEYDLPAHIYPPKNAEPILMVDPDYMNRRKKKSKQSSGGSTLNFLPGGSAPGIGTSPTTSNIIYNNGSSSSDRLRHTNSSNTSSTNSTPSRSRKSTPSVEACDCDQCRSGVPSDPYTKSGSYSTQSSKSSKVVTTVNLTTPPVPPPAYQARSTPRSTKKSKALSQQQQIQQQIQQQQLQLQLQQQQQQKQPQQPPSYHQQPQPLVYPVPPPSYATATSTYGSYHHHKSLCTSICPTLCAGCTTPMVGAGPPELVPHGFSTAHVVRSRGSPKLRSRRHLTASTTSHLPDYHNHHRRARANTIGHTSTSATQHHNSLPTSLLSSETNQSTSQSRLQDSLISQGLIMNQTELQQDQQPTRDGKISSKRRVAQNPQYDFDILEARIADTAQMYSAPITPAELMDEDLFGRGVTDMDTSSGYSYHNTSSTKNNNNATLNNKNNTSNVFSLGAKTSVASRIYAHEKAMEAKTNNNSISITNSISSSRLPRKSNSSSSRNNISGTASINNVTNSSNVSASNNTNNASISVSSHQYQQQQQQQQQQRSHQPQNQFLSHLFRQQEYLKTSSPSNQPTSTLSTPSRLSGLGGHHDISSMNQESNSLGASFSSSTNFGTGTSFGSSSTPINYREFLIDNVMMASSPQPSATALFSSPLASHIASQMLGVPTPPQSNSMPTVPVPSVSANRFLASMYQLNTVPPYNLVY